MERLTEGTEWETTAGYSRAVRVGRRIAVSGTTGHPPAGSDEPLGATYAQAVRALARALAAAQELGRGAAVVYVHVSTWLQEPDGRTPPARIASAWVMSRRRTPCCTCTR
jgi:enamine deaminase RidA (YjgF/YER057c/UK114 family)